MRMTLPSSLLTVEQKQMKEAFQEVIDYRDESFKKKTCAGYLKGHIVTRLMICRLSLRLHAQLITHIIRLIFCRLSSVSTSNTIKRHEIRIRVHKNALLNLYKSLFFLSALQSLFKKQRPTRAKHASSSNSGETVHIKSGTKQKLSGKEAVVVSKRFTERRSSSSSDSSDDVLKPFNLSTSGTDGGMEGSYVDVENRAEEKEGEKKQEN